jgi:hypothetical protein
MNLKASTACRHSAKKITFAVLVVLEHFSACYILLGERTVQLFFCHWSGKPAWLRRKRKG